MPTKIFTSGRIRKADYNPTSRQLDLHWENNSVLAYKHVPEEVYRRLSSAPNPATYRAPALPRLLPVTNDSFLPLMTNVDVESCLKSWETLARGTAIESHIMELLSVTSNRGKFIQWSQFLREKVDDY